MLENLLHVDAQFQRAKIFERYLRCIASDQAHVRCSKNSVKLNSAIFFAQMDSTLERAWAEKRNFIRDLY